MKTWTLVLALACLGFPAEARTAAPKGTLVIVGGGGTTPDIERAFLDAAGGRGGVVDLDPTSTSEP